MKQGGGPRANGKGWQERGRKEYYQWTLNLSAVETTRCGKRALFRQKTHVILHDYSGVRDEKIEFHSPEIAPGQGQKLDFRPIRQRGVRTKNPVRFKDEGVTNPGTRNRDDLEEVHFNTRM